jgi:hypothetical protein
MKKGFVLFMLLLLLASCGTSQSSASQPPQRSGGAIHPGYWIISRNAINLLEKNGASESFLATLFNNSHSYILIGLRQTNPFPLSIPVVSFTSYGDVSASHVVGMASAFSRNLLPKGTKAIAYDDENWRFTATSEIAHPASSTEEASKLAHQAGLQFISLPGMDLGTSATGNIQSLPQSYYSFVKDGYLQMARYDDIFELQLENREKSADFVTLTQQARNRVKAINPKVIFFVQLTSNPNSQVITAEDLMKDYRATRGFVDGYALTIPDSAAICPACGTPDVQAMLAFLQAVEKESS